MKKRLLMFFAAIVAVITSTTCIAFSVLAEDNYDYVYTPNGTPVLVLINTEFTEAEIEYIQSQIDYFFPNVIEQAQITNIYNCHSFAWYEQNASNIYWMPNPSAYYMDYSYEESTGNVGDIICYFDSTGFNLHSGIVIARQSGTPNGVCGDANLVTVLSKWGGAGLYQHQGDYCPYVSTYGGSATYVKYYKLHIHTFVYTSYEDYHLGICSVCGAQQFSNHSYSYTIFDDYHIGNCICGKQVIANHNHSYTNYNTIYHTVTCICGENVLESHTLRTVKIDDYTHSTNCTKCSYSVIEAHDFRLSGLWYICRTCGARVSALDGPIPQPYGLEPVIS